MTMDIKDFQIPRLGRAQLDSPLDPVDRFHRRRRDRRLRQRCREAGRICAEGKDDSGFRTGGAAREDLSRPVLVQGGRC